MGGQSCRNDMAIRSYLSSAELAMTSTLTHTSFCLASLKHPARTWRSTASEIPWPSPLALMSEFSEGTVVISELWDPLSKGHWLWLSKGWKKGTQYIKFLLFGQVLLYGAFAFGSIVFPYFTGEKKYPYLKHSCQSKTQFKLQYKA